MAVWRPLWRASLIGPVARFSPAHGVEQGALAHARGTGQADAARQAITGSATPLPVRALAVDDRADPARYSPKSAVSRGVRLKLVGNDHGQPRCARQPRKRSIIRTWGPDRRTRTRPPAVEVGDHEVLLPERRGCPAGGGRSGCGGSNLFDHAPRHRTGCQGHRSPTTRSRSGARASGGHGAGIRRCRIRLSRKERRAHAAHGPSQGGNRHGCSSIRRGVGPRERAREREERPAAGSGREWS